VPVDEPLDPFAPEVPVFALPLELLLGVTVDVPVLFPSAPEPVLFELDEPDELLPDAEPLEPCSTGRSGEPLGPDGFDGLLGSSRPTPPLVPLPFCPVIGAELSE